MKPPDLPEKRIAVEHPAPPRWWTDPAWLRLSYACPKCGLTTAGVPEAGERCPRCGCHERGE